MPVNLQVLTVASPCPADFAAMPRIDVAGRVRHCAQCDQPVFDLSALPRADAERLVADHWEAGRPVCARLNRRADGTVVSADATCVGRWRLAVAARAARWGGPVGAVLSVVVAATAAIDPATRSAPQLPGSIPPPPASRPASQPTILLGQLQAR